jgi:hypothetical protein
MSYLLSAVGLRSYSEVLATPEHLYASVANHLSALVGSGGGLGDALFNWTLVVIVSKKIADLVKSNIEKLFTASTPVTAQTFKEAQRDCIFNVGNLEGIDALPEKREITIRYCDTLDIAKVPVTGYAEEVELAFAAAARAAAVSQGKLVKITCEEIITGNDIAVKGFIAPVEKAVVAAYEHARGQLNQLLADDEAVTSADKLLDVIAKQA